MSIIEDVEHIANCCGEGTNWKRILLCAADLLRTHPDSQPSEPQGDGWISVDDKDNPPPEGKKVIAYLKLSGGDICETAYYMGEDGWYYTGWEAPHHGVVTHWRPLPEPPKEATNER